MAFEEKVLYLRLSPEFGGTRFGHFEQRVVRLGSDPSCDIAIAQGFGVAPEHAQVIFDGANNIIVAPADRAADVYLWKPHAPRPDLVSTPTAIRPGESFALATPNGPRFIIELDELPEEVKAARDKMGGPRIGGRKLTGKAMGDEVKRQAWTSLLVMAPMQMAQRAYIFVKSGAILQPRNIILGVTMLGGYIIGGASLCSARKSSADLVSSQAAVKGCKEELAAAVGSESDPVKMKFSDLAGRIVGSTRVATALKDRKFAKVVKERTKNLLMDPGAYSWLFRPGSKRANRLVDWRSRLYERDDLSGDMANLLVWMAAPPDAKPLETPNYVRQIDSENSDACARGPLGVTYRQAFNMGMGAQLDAFHRGSSSSIEDNSIRKEKLQEVATSLEAEMPEELTMEIVGADSSGKAYCIYAEGDDDRDRFASLMPYVDRHFDKNDEKTVPIEAGGKGLTAKLARWYAADLFSSSYDPSRRLVKGIDFKKASSSIHSVFENEGSRGDWVIERAADIYARAIAVPCIGVLDTEKEADQIQAVLGDNMPNAIHCLVLNYQLTTE